MTRDELFSKYPVDGLSEDARRFARDAILVQSACNLSGLAHSLFEQMCKLPWNSTGERNKHPAVAMFVHQMAFLSGADQFYDDSLAYGWVYDWCKKAGEAAAPVVEPVETAELVGV